MAEQAQQAVSFAGAGAPLALAVDDDAQVRTLFAVFLAMAGYEVLTACDGAEALDLCHVHRDDLTLLVTDIEMPRLSGIELARAIVQELPGLPIVLVSGNLLTIDENRVAEQFGWKLLQKPIKRDVLIQTATSLCSGYKKQTAPVL